LKKKITSRSNKSNKEEKKGPESKDFFDLAVKILPKLDIFPEHKSKRRCPDKNAMKVLGQFNIIKFEFPGKPYRGTLLRGY
jgi:hypothetical protein